MNIKNQTPFIVSPLILMDGSGAENLVAVIKGTWKIGANGTLFIADEQVPVQRAPVYRGDPKTSSLIYESDAVLEKPGTDCVLIGHAYAQLPKTRKIDVTFAVGSVQKTVRVFGDRICSRILGIKAKSKPAIFDKIPLTYENAFGGVDFSPRKSKHHATYPDNPVGRGFRAKRSRLKFTGLKLPNLEYPFGKKPAGKSKAAGFGMVSAHWRPRCRYAGTYDENWHENISPLPPGDLDPRFYCCAASGLTSNGHLLGNEGVLVKNATPNGMLQFSLPNVKPRISCMISGTILEIPVKLDTVIVEPDEKRLQLVWRGRRDIHLRVREIEWVQATMGQNYAR